MQRLELGSLGAPTSAARFDSLPRLAWPLFIGAFLGEVGSGPLEVLPRARWAVECGRGNRGGRFFDFRPGLSDID